MKRAIGIALSSAGLLVAGAAGTIVLGVGTAIGATTTPTPATFQMFANVDAEGDLGSNYDALTAGIYGGSIDYFVKFKKPIGGCAAVVQVGKAGESDEPSPATPIMTPAGPQRFNITFENPDGNAVDLVHNPFMMMVTCAR